MLIGLLEGITGRAKENREAQAAQLEKTLAQETSILSKLASDDSVEPEIRDRASTALLELATGGKRPTKGGFLSRLLGTDAIQPHPAVKSVMDFIRSPEVVGGGMKVRVPDAEQYTPPPAGAQPAAQPPRAITQGGGPPTVAAVGSPSGPDAGAQTVAVQPPPPMMVPTPFSPQQLNVGTKEVTTPGASVSRRVFRSPAEIARTTAVNKEQGEVEGRIAGRIAMGMTRENALALERTGALGAQGWAEGEVIQKPDGRWVQVLYNRQNPTQQMELPATAPAAKSVGVPNADAQLANELFGEAYKATNPSITPQEILRGLTPGQQAQLTATKLKREVQQTGANRSATLAANAARALDPSERLNAETGFRNDLFRYTATARTAQQNASVVETAYTDYVDAVTNNRISTPQEQAIIQAFGKLIDPLSTVREAEFNRSTEGQPIMTRARALWEQWTRGTLKVDRNTIAEIVSLTRNIKQTYDAFVANEATTTRSAVRAYGLNEGSVFTPDIQALLPAEKGAATPPPSPIQTPAQNPIAAPPPAAGTPPPSPGASPAAATTTAPPAPLQPRVGMPVGNPFPGDVSTLRQLPDGRILGKLQNGQTVEVVNLGGQYFLK